VVEMVDTVATEVEEEATAKVHLREVLLRGCSRRHTLVTALLAWTTTVLHRLRRRRLQAFHLHPLPATCRRPLPRHLSSGWQSRILIIL